MILLTISTKDLQEPKKMTNGVNSTQMVEKNFKTKFRRNEMQQEFKQKYFANNFYWVNKENYKRLQEIALEVGCLCHTGKAEIIKWYEGFKNLGFRTYEKNNNVTVFQKEEFLFHNETATDFNE